MNYIITANDNQFISSSKLAKLGNILLQPKKACESTRKY